MSILSLKNQISAFFEQQLDSTRQRLDSNLSSCLIENPTASRLTEPLDSLDSLDSNLEGRGGKQKPCNIGNSVQEISESELIYPQHTTNAANDQEAQEEAYWHEFIYGKPTEELLYNHLLTCPLCHVKVKQYCLYGAELGKQYDALLLNSEHAQERRTALVMQVDRANITGNKRYIPFQPAPF